MLTAFADLGRVVALPATSRDTQTAMQLRGQGLSLSWQAPTGLSTKLTWSRRSGTHPQPTQTGTDGDGTVKLNRIWFTTTLPF